MNINTIYNMILKLRLDLVFSLCPSRRSGRRRFCFGAFAASTASAAFYPREQGMHFFLHRGPHKTSRLHLSRLVPSAEVLCSLVAWLCEAVVPGGALQTAAVPAVSRRRLLLFPAGVGVAPT
jgi:hypothetical protein